jgi:hypothetical protein
MSQTTASKLDGESNGNSDPVVISENNGNGLQPFKRNERAKNLRGTHVVPEELNLYDKKNNLYINSANFDDEEEAKPHSDKAATKKPRKPSKNGSLSNKKQQAEEITEKEDDNVSINSQSVPTQYKQTEQTMNSPELNRKKGSQPLIKEEDENKPKPNPKAPFKFVSMRKMMKEYKAPKKEYPENVKIPQYVPPKRRGTSNYDKPKTKVPQQSFAPKSRPSRPNSKPPQQKVDNTRALSFKKKGVTQFKPRERSGIGQMLLEHTLEYDTTSYNS